MSGCSDTILVLSVLRCCVKVVKKRNVLLFLFILSLPRRRRRLDNLPRDDAKAHRAVAMLLHVTPHPSPPPPPPPRPLAGQIINPHTRQRYNVTREFCAAPCYASIYKRLLRDTLRKNPSLIPILSRQAPAPPRAPPFALEETEAGLRGPDPRGDRGNGGGGGGGGRPGELSNGVNSPRSSSSGFTPARSHPLPRGPGGIDILSAPKGPGGIDILSGPPSPARGGAESEAYVSPRQGCCSSSASAAGSSPPSRVTGATKVEAAAAAAGGDGSNDAVAAAAAMLGLGARTAAGGGGGGGAGGRVMSSPVKGGDVANGSASAVSNGHGGGGLGRAANGERGEEEEGIMGSRCSPPLSPKSEERARLSAEGWNSKARAPLPDNVSGAAAEAAHWQVGKELRYVCCRRLWRKAASGFNRRASGWVNGRVIGVMRSLCQPQYIATLKYVSAAVKSL